MGRVISLQEYVQAKTEKESSAHDGVPGRPEVSKADIWRRDFSTFENVLYGLLTVRRLLDHHLHFHEDWKHYILMLLDMAYLGSPASGGPSAISEIISMFKAYLFEETTAENKEDMALVMLILELIEKSYDLKSSSRS
jgi:hypothetical protein